MDIINKNFERVTQILPVDSSIGVGIASDTIKANITLNVPQADVQYVIFAISDRDANISVLNVRDKILLLRGDKERKFTQKQAIMNERYVKVMELMKKK